MGDATTGNDGRKKKENVPTGAKPKTKAGSEDGRPEMAKAGKSPDADVRIGKGSGGGGQGRGRGKVGEEELGRVLNGVQGFGA